MFAANEGYLDELANADIAKFKVGWFEYFDANLGELAEKLNNRSALEDADKELLREHLDKYKLGFFG